MSNPCRYAKLKEWVSRKCVPPRFEHHCLDSSCRYRACVPVYVDVKRLYEDLQRLLIREPWRVAETEGGALMATIAYSGCRLGECLALTTRDVGGLAADESEVPEGYIRVPTEKRKQQEYRLVPVPRALMKMLQIYAVKAGATDRLFSYSPSAARRAVEKASCELVDKAWPPHALRHAWAIKMIVDGVPITKVRYWGGWSETETLLEIYARYVATREELENPWGY